MTTTFHVLADPIKLEFTLENDGEYLRLRAKRTDDTIGPYYLLKITQQGQLILNSHISKSLGLDIDDQGHLIPIKETI